MAAGVRDRVGARYPALPRAGRCLPGQGQGTGRGVMMHRQDAKSAKKTKSLSSWRSWRLGGSSLRRDRFLDLAQAGIDQPAEELDIEPRRGRGRRLPLHGQCEPLALVLDGLDDAVKG